MRITIPGMLDPHVHMRDLDWSHKATFATETAAAIAGGYWAVFDMPNTLPSTVDRPSLNQKLAAISQRAYCDWGVYFGASQVADAQLYESVIEQVCGLKIYNNATTGELLIEDQSVRDTIYQVWPTQRPIAVHAEEETVLDILALVRRYHTLTHFCHISTAMEIEALQAAKEEGLPVTIGVTPHHLYLSEDDLPALGSFGLMKPTLKTRADCDALWAAVSNGVVDIIESDHAPHTLAEKASDLPPYGVPGLETTLPLMCLALQQRKISIDRLIDLLAINPCGIFGVQPDENTYTRVDLDDWYTIDRANLRSACGWSPFEGMRVPGKVLEVWIRGQQVFDGENILVPQGFGVNVHRGGL
jgi:dihydroorotase